MFEIKLPAMLWFENGNKVFCAACKFRLPWNAKSNIDEYAVAYFEGSEKGKLLAETWISRQVFVPNISIETMPTACRVYKRMLPCTVGKQIENTIEEFLDDEK